MSKRRFYRRLVPALEALVVCATAFGLLAIAPGCKPGDEEAAPGATAEAPRHIARVEVATISPVPFSATTTLIGETEADEAITVSAEAPGRILQANYEEGEPVVKGQWLARVEATVDRTRVGQLSTNLQQAERDLARLEELKGKGLATEAQIEQARLGVENARYNVKMTRAGISKTSVAAPIGGIVDRVFLEQGEFASPGAPLVTIVNFDTIVVRAGLPESQLTWATAGKAVKVRIVALDRVVDAKIRRVGIQANTRNRTFPLVIEVPNADHGIRPGMRADVVLSTEHYDAGILVPRNSVLESVDARIVFAVENDAAVRRVVEVGPGRGDFVLIRRGVSAGDKIVTVGQRLISNGEPVKVLADVPCCAAQLDALDKSGPQASKAAGEPSEAVAQ